MESPMTRLALETTGALALILAACANKRVSRAIIRWRTSQLVKSPDAERAREELESLLLDQGADERAMVSIDILVRTGALRRELRARALAAQNLEPSPDLRSERRAYWRGFLHSVNRDYLEQLAAIRKAVLDTGTERPTLTRALAKNQILFRAAVFKSKMLIELHALGIGRVDLSILVDALETMRAQVAILTPDTCADTSPGRGERDRAEPIHS